MNLQRSQSLLYALYTILTFELIIRGKLSTAVTIDSAIGDDGKSIPEFKGKTVNKLPSKSCADLDVTFASGHKNRIIVRYNPNCTDDDKRSILRTNIPRDRLGAKRFTCSTDLDGLLNCLTKLISVVTA